MAVASFNVAQVTMRLLAMGAAAHRGAAKGLDDATEHILGVSRDRVPIEEGILERSGATYVDAEELKGYVYYDTPYAPKQHEDLTLNHDEGREAKYLESAFNSERDTIRELIVDAIRGSF